MPPATPKDHSELLEVFRLGLLYGAIDKREVVRWADAIIEQEETPDYFFIELALAGSKSVFDLASWLQSGTYTAALPQVGRVILGLLYHRYLADKLTLAELTQRMERLAWEDALSEAEASQLCGLNDDYELAVAGLKDTVTNVEREVLQVLEVYQEFRLDNVVEWPQLHAQVDARLRADTFRPAEQARPWWKFW